MTQRTYIVLPVETVQKAVNILQQLPYSQVGAVMEEIKRETRTTTRPPKPRRSEE